MLGARMNGDGMVGGEPLPLLIFPCNGNGLEAIDCLGDQFQCIGFVDDVYEKQEADQYGCWIYGRAALNEFREARVLAVPGSPTSFRSRKEVVNGLGVDTNRFARVIHRRASVASLAKVGYNVLVMAGVVITSNCVIGNHVCILPNTVIHHDVTIGDWSIIGSNVTISGGTTLEENCYIGSGSSIMNGLHLGTGAMLGLGSNLISNVPPGATAAGNPARSIR
jgi:sugar O-acyltransferase (sialic acid O-acetyltransferase NeuD family)